MDYPTQLLIAHSRENADLILQDVLKDEANVRKLMDAFLGAEYRVSQRAAMVVGNLGRKHPEWLRPWHAEMIRVADAGKHDAVRRNVMRYFSELPVTAVEEVNQGPLLDLAFRLTESPLMAVAIRVFSMTVVANFCGLYPELKDELRGIIERTIMEGTTPGFRSRGEKILQQLVK